MPKNGGEKSKHVTRNSEMSAILILFVVNFSRCLKGWTVTKNRWKLKIATIQADHKIKMAFMYPRNAQVISPPHQPQFMNEATGIRHCRPTEAVSDAARQQINKWICLAAFGDEVFGLVFSTARRAKMLTKNENTNRGKMSTLKQAWSSGPRELVLFMLSWKSISVSLSYLF